ncbi:hypothetical protein D3C73_1099360 [compost metagenome]
MMPIRMAPRTRKASSEAMMKKPRMANSGPWVVRSPRETLVAGWATTMPALDSAIIARNSPMPAAIALRRECGMPLTSHTRMPDIVNIKKITPEMNTAPSACSQV